MKEQENIITAFEEMAPRYEKLMNSELHRFWGWSYDEFVNTLLSKMHVKEKGAILDVATGTSYIPARLLQNHNELGQVIGLDITFKMLQLGQKKIMGLPNFTRMSMVCASAMRMPLADQSIDMVLCGLATHHMDVTVLLSEMKRVLKYNGDIAIADVGGSRFWKNPIIKMAIRILAFIYFFITENKSRAWAEASALTNIRTAEEWQFALKESSFEEIIVSPIKSRRFWAPNPLIIHANKKRRKQHG